MVYKGKSLINSEGFELKSIVSQVSILQNNGDKFKIVVF